MSARRATTVLLDIDKLDEIIEELRHYGFPEIKWFELGLQLGILHNALKAIEAVHGANISRALLECLTKWLRNEDTKPSAGPFTWQRLVKALTTIKEKKIADKISKTMTAPASQLLQLYSGRLSQIVLTERTVQLLHTERVISEGTATGIESCGGLIVGDSLRAIYTAVAESHSKLKLIANILLNTDEAVSLANEITRDYEKTFILASSAAVQRASWSPMSNTESIESASDHARQLPSYLEIPICRDDIISFDRMRNIFGCFLHNIAPLIRNKVPSVDDLKLFLKRARPEIKSHLALAETFDEVIEVIEEKCTIINVTLLECIVDQYSIDDAKELIRNYNKKLDEFCSHENSLKFCHNTQLKTMSTSHLSCETIKFVLNWEIDDHTLNDIRDLLSKAFSSMANRVEVVIIKEGSSITITCYAPHYLMESLLMIARGNLDLLKEEGLIILTIGYYTVYNQRVIDEETEKYKVAAEERVNILTIEQNEIKKELQAVTALLQEKEKEIELYQSEQITESETSSKQYRLTRKRTSEESEANVTKKFLKETSVTEESEDNLQQEIAHLPITQEGQELIAQKEINRKMTQEIDQLRFNLKSTQGIEKDLIDSKEEITALQEKVSSLSVQLLMGKSNPQRINKSTQSDYEFISQLESLQLFQFAMSDQTVADISKIINIRSHSDDDKAALFLKYIDEDPFLLAELKHMKSGETTGTIEWTSDEGVWLTSPSPKQCQEVISQLNTNNSWVRLEQTYPNLISLVVPLILQKQVISDLNIVYTPLTPQSISSFSFLANDSLKTLYLCYSSVTDNEMFALSELLRHKLTSLTQLYLSSNPEITDSSAQDISNILSNNALTLLSLWGTSLTTEGVEIILNSLVNNQILKTLKLDKTHESFCHLFSNYKQVENILSFI